MSPDQCRDIRSINKDNTELLIEAKTILQEMLEAWEYFSEYDVPIGMKESIENLLLKL